MLTLDEELARLGKQKYAGCIEFSTVGLTPSTLATLGGWMEKHPTSILRVRGDIPPALMPQFAKAALQGTRLHALSISNCALDVHAVEVLGKTLAGQPLEELTISDCAMDSDGIAEIGTLIRYLPELRFLDFRAGKNYDPWSSEIAWAISECPLLTEIILYEKRAIKAPWKASTRYTFLPKERSAIYDSLNSAQKEILEQFCSVFNSDDDYQISEKTNLRVIVREMQKAGSFLQFSHLSLGVSNFAFDIFFRSLLIDKQNYRREDPSKADECFATLSRIVKSLKENALDPTDLRWVAENIPSIKLFMRVEDRMAKRDIDRILYRCGFLLEQVSPEDTGAKHLQVLQILDLSVEMTIESKRISITDRLEMARGISQALVKDYDQALSAIDFGIQEAIAQHSAVEENRKQALARIRDASRTNEGLDAAIEKAQRNIQFGMQRWEAERKARTQGVWKRPVTTAAITLGLKAVGGAAVALTGGAAAPLIGLFLGALAIKDIDVAIKDAVGDYAYARQRNQVSFAQLEVQIAQEQDIIKRLTDKKVERSAAEKAAKALSRELTLLGENKNTQQLFREQKALDRLAHAILVERIVERGLNITQRVERRYLKEHGFNSPDEWLDALTDDPQLCEAVGHFLAGRANTADMHVMLEDGHAVNSAEATPALLVLDVIVENVIKRDIGDFLTRASMIDFAEHGGMLSPGKAGSSLAETEADRDNQSRTAKMAKFALMAMFADQTGVSHIGNYDVRRLFSFYLHRHGNTEISDTQVEDGRISYDGANFADKRVSLIEPDEADRFRERFKRAYSYRDQQPPKISDLFLRICAYEYYLPQSVHGGGGGQHKFSENPEAPVGIVMANSIIHNFIYRIANGGINEYREKVGDKIDAIVTQTFFDFFNRMGKKHRNGFSSERNQLREAYRHDGAGPIFSDMEETITGDAQNHFPLFLELYAQNLEKTLQITPKREIPLVEKQIENARGLAEGRLALKLYESGSKAARARSRRPASEQRGENMTEEFAFPRKGKTTGQIAAS